MPKNQDLSPPNLNPTATRPLSFKQFVDGLFPVYWLPGQYYNPSGSNYTWTVAELPTAPTLHIPKMGRFLHTYPDTKDLSEEWGDAEIDDGPVTEAASLHLWQWSELLNPPSLPGKPEIYDYFECLILGFTPTFQDGLNRNYLAPGVCSATVVVKKNGSIIDSKLVGGFTSWSPPGFGPYAQVTTSCP